MKIQIIFYVKNTFEKVINIFSMKKLVAKTISRPTVILFLLKLPPGTSSQGFNWIGY